MPITEDKFPEHTKLKAIADQSQIIGEFLDNSEYVLATYDSDYGLQPVGKPLDRILAEYFDINLDTIETEKRQMLAELSSLNQPKENHA